MIIDVDMGNTRLKWRQFGEQTVHACQDWQQALEQWALLGVVTRVRISSVIAKEKQKKFSLAIQRAFGMTPEFARTQNDVSGIRLAYKDFHLLGVDRWLSMLAVRAIDSRQSWLVFNAGTALTADLLRSDGAHLGGYIVPGMHLSALSLNLNTAQIPHVAIAEEKIWQPGGSTLECVQAGLSTMYQAYVQAVFSRTSELVPNLRIAWSGGDAVTLKSLLEGDIDDLVSPALVLDGLSVALP